MEDLDIIPVGISHGDALAVGRPGGVAGPFKLTPSISILAKLTLKITIGA